MVLDTKICILLGCTNFTMTLHGSLVSYTGGIYICHLNNSLRLLFYYSTFTYCLLRKILKNDAHALDGVSGSSAHLRISSCGELTMEHLRSIFAKTFSNGILRYFVYHPLKLICNISSLISSLHIFIANIVPNILHSLTCGRGL